MGRLRGGMLCRGIPRAIAIWWPVIIACDCMFTWLSMGTYLHHSDLSAGGLSQGYRQDQARARVCRRVVMDGGFEGAGGGRLRLGYS